MQGIVDRLFAGLAPDAFREVPFFLCTENVRPPQGFEARWAYLPEDEEVDAHGWLRDCSETARAASAVVVVAQLPHEGPRLAKSVLAAYTGASEGAMPPLLLLPVGEPTRPRSSRRRGAAAWGRQLVSSGCVDDVILGAPEGFALALGVQAKLCQISSRLQHLENEVRLQNSALDRYEDINSTISITRWQYLPARMLHNIPPVQDDLQDDDRAVAGYRLGPRLAGGLLGGYRIAIREEGRALSCNMLVIEKDQAVYGLHDLRMINKYLGLLNELTNHRHPNISHLLAVYHTETRLCVCTELSGEQTLYGRLKMRDRPRPGTERVPLPGYSMVSLMRQVASAAAHLHANRIFHRDIKPENFTAHENQGRIQVKLGGFELARAQVEDKASGSPCGTMPFAAPEMILHWTYNGLLADMWSVGVVFVELSCGIRLVETALRQWCNASFALQDDPNMTLEAFRKHAQHMWSVFSTPGAVERLFDHAVPEAVDMRPWLLPLLSSLLSTRAYERPPAKDVLDQLP